MERTAPSTPIYLDHAASSPMSAEVLEVFSEALRSTYGNASATGHWHGERARVLVERAREQVAELVGADPSGVLFTSGTTESNHLAIRGLLTEFAGAHAVTTVIEHPAVAELFSELEGRGLACTRAPCAGDGRVSTAAILAALRPSTRLVSVMHGNNETGALCDIQALAAALRDHHHLALHVDAAQSARSQPIDVLAWGLGCVSLSAHKMGGPKGVGALVCAPKVLRQLRPMFVGGGQERGLRSGTINAPAIAAFGKACELARAHGRSSAEVLRARARAFFEAIVAGVPEARLVGPELGAHRLPGIVTLRIPGVPATLLQAEVRADVSIATGAACATSKLEASPTLTAMGLRADEALEVVRVSIGPSTTDEELRIAARALVDAARRLTR